MNLAGTGLNGLTEQEVIEARNLHGSNEMQIVEHNVFRYVIKEVVLQPMFLLLLAATIIYFIAGQIPDGIIMLVSIFIVTGISLFQEYRSQNAVAALRNLSAPRAKVIREAKETQIYTGEIVVGDLMILEEGEIIAADGKVINAHDFSVNESIITGESFSVYKSQSNNDTVYKGTLVTSGNAIVKTTGVGVETMFYKIGLSLSAIRTTKTPLQIQINSFVRKMIWLSAFAFLLVIGFNYYRSGNMLISFLQGLTLAMSILPEEIPVAFSTFQALGAYRLLRKHVIVKQPHFVETLGSATVICTDKTGTLTQNKMKIEFLFDAQTKKSVSPGDTSEIPSMLLEYAMWSSETEPFDPMEKEIHKIYEKTALEDKRPYFVQIHEYPVGGKPPMMTHIFENKTGDKIIAAKGAPEAILKLSDLSPGQLKFFEEQSLSFARRGYRVLGIGKGLWSGEKWPMSQEEFVFIFLGLIAFNDPPKENIQKTIQTFKDAGIKVKIITGDYAETALAIANLVGLTDGRRMVTGDEVLRLSKADLMQKVQQVNIFARMFPEAKLKVIDALKECGEIVAMTGDGVNDAPALKAAHIGIAMGIRGSEVARSAASVVLADDDLSHMTEAIALGRKIYANLKKAIRYIVSIHIPIILIVTLPLLFFWKYTDIFSPVHVIFLELIMGPTCSIIYENEPMEPGAMQQPPRQMTQTFLSGRQLLVSVAQGIAITIGCLGIGYYFMFNHNEDSVRTVIFITLLFSNIFLTLVNRSFIYSIFTTIRYRNKLLLYILGTTLLMILLLLEVPVLRQLFRLQQLSLGIIATCALVAFATTVWMEIVKWGQQTLSKKVRISG
jgi:P-type Ca2+ transporter type 2C